MSKITRIAFEQRYSDNSGAEFGVYFNASDSGEEIQFERVKLWAAFPLDKLDWLIECLAEIRAITKVAP